MPPISVVLETMFLPLNSLGLLLMGLSMVGMLCRKRKGSVMSVAPAAFTNSAPFIIMMVVGLGGICVGLSTVSVKMKKSPVMILFILSFVFAMAMGYMSGQDPTQSWVNWAEQSINSVSQLCLMLGVIVLHKSGLKDRVWEETEI